MAKRLLKAIAKSYEDKAKRFTHSYKDPDRGDMYGHVAVNLAELAEETVPQVLLDVEEKYEEFIEAVRAYCDPNGFTTRPSVGRDCAERIHNNVIDTRQRLLDAVTGFGQSGAPAPRAVPLPRLNNVLHR